MLLDTSGILCYHHRDEAKHEDAVSLFEPAGPKIVHNYVLAEYVALALARGLLRQSTLSFLEALLEHPEVEVMWVDRPLHAAAMSLLQNRMDKRYSLCDAVSFVIMTQRGISDALTTDHHFEQEQFCRLL